MSRAIEFLVEMVNANQKALPLLCLLATEEARSAKLTKGKIPFPPSTRKRDAYEETKVALANAESFLKKNGWTVNGIDGHLQPPEAA